MRQKNASRTTDNTSGVQPYEVCETCGAMVVEWGAHVDFHHVLELMRKTIELPQSGTG